MPFEIQIAAKFDQNREYITPNIFGHQWCSPAKNAIAVEPIIT